MRNAGDRQIRNLIEQRLQETPNLPVGGGPIPARVGIDRLVKMPEWSSEVVLIQQYVNFIISCWKVQRFWECAEELSIIDDISCTFQSPYEPLPVGSVRRNTPGRLFHDKTAKEVSIVAGRRIVSQEPKKITTALMDRARGCFQLIELPAKNKILKLAMEIDSGSQKAASLEYYRTGKGHDLNDTTDSSCSASSTSTTEA